MSDGEPRYCGACCRDVTEEDGCCSNCGADFGRDEGLTDAEASELLGKIMEKRKHD